MDLAGKPLRYLIGADSDGIWRTKCWCRKCDDELVASIGDRAPGVVVMRRFIVCPNCGNKRCPRATASQHMTRPLTRSGKQLSVRRRQVLYIVADHNGIASHRISSALGITTFATRNALQGLKHRGLVSFYGAWSATPAGKEWVNSMRNPNHDLRSHRTALASPPA